MIDEWGNEIAENKLLSLKEKIIKNKNLLIFLVSVFVLTLVLIQVLASLFLPLNKKQNETVQPIVTTSPKNEKRLSRVATSSAFRDLESAVASQSAEIENTDMYESTLVFPSFDQKVELNEN